MSTLIDRKELYELFPAFRGKGMNPHHRTDWLIRTRKMPGMVRVGRRIFFDPEKIREYIESNGLPVQDGVKKNN